MTDEALDIMAPGAEITDEQLARIDTDADLRKACEDIFVAQTLLGREQTEQLPNVEERLNKFKSRHRRRAIVRRLAVAISMAAAVAAAIFILRPTQEAVERPFFEAQTTETKPVVTTPDGRNVPMRLVANAGNPDRTIVIDNAEMPLEQLQLSVPYGESLQIDLPDGSKMYLHPGSRLIYPTRFTGNRREVRLEGEAYFSVTRDTQHPFVVATPRTQTTVLGTEFDITAFPSAPERITLVSGSVTCAVVNARQEVITSSTLTPGQQAILTNQSSVFSIEEVDTEPYTSWRDGYFYFDETPLRDILNELGRYYNVTVQCRRPSLLDYRMRFIIPRNKDVAYAVEMINRMQKVHAVLSGNTILIN